MSAQRGSVSNDLELLQESAEQIVPWGLSLVNPCVAFDYVSDHPIRIAIIDSGIYASHPDLKGKVVSQHSAVSGNDYIGDITGHGTAVAGVMTANNNQIGTVGMSQNIAIYSVNVVSEDARINQQDFIRGIEWAIEQDVDIINISLGFSKATDELRRVINQAIEQGVIVISASGNTHGMNALFPARFEHVISVGAIDENHEIIAASAIGKIDFVAPGANILSLTYEGGYDLFHGSSFATAFVTGIVAHYLSQNEVPRNRYTQATIFSYLESISMTLNDSRDRVGNGIPIVTN